MMSIAEEIQAVSDNADKCINYPIGDKLAAFIKHQDESMDKTNFILSGVLIYAAAKIFGRKVDYLEQEIIGIAKNFEAVATSDEKQPEKEAAKKSRSKKFVIKDRVNIEKTTFDEKPINVLTKIDINKTLATPSKINRLQKMKEFFAKNKSRSGKLVIPKNLLFANEYVGSNFGSSQIHDYDDNKEIVGSRKDFTCFSYFVNNCTGELQSDVDLSSNNSTPSDDHFRVSNRENIEDISEPSTPKDRFQSPVDWTTRPCTPTNFCEPSADVETKLTDWSHLNIDEGIEMDEVERANMLLPVQPTVHMIDIRVKSPSLFPPDLQVNESIDMDDFDRSVLTVPLELTANVSDFDLPAKLKNDVNDMKIRNIFLIPLKKLKHKCIFDLPNGEFGELKKRKRDQHKSMGVDLSLRQTRMFKPLDLSSDDHRSSGDLEDPPFLGFTKAQQQEPMTSISSSWSIKPLEKSSPTDIQIRKFSNDSGLESDCSAELSNNLSEDQTDFDASNSEDQHESFDVTHNTTEPDCNINISGGDSCYQSLVSGDSTKAELSSFFKDIESRNQTINESEEAEENCEESEERVLQMQQSAINIAKWKEYLKPILADSEARSKIDMHQYGVEMIGKIGNVNDSVSLDEITETGRTPAYFLTMLQLINNRNVDIEFGERSMHEPVDTKNIKITLKSKALHQEKFSEMGEQFTADEVKKVKNLKRKGVQTSTPAKRIQLGESSVSFGSLNASESMMEVDQDNTMILSQASSGYYSQNSVLSDF